MTRTGRCLCGAIQYTAELSGEKFGACHCGMCRRWTSGPLLSIQASVTWTGEKPTTYASSEHADRGFCNQCGSTLFYRFRSAGDDGPVHLAFGSLDDPSGLTLGRQLFFDQKPDGYAFANETRNLTQAEIFAMFAANA